MKIETIQRVAGVAFIVAVIALSVVAKGAMGATHAHADADRCCVAEASAR